MDNRKSTLVLALLPVIGFIVSFVYAFGFSDWNNITPLFSLPAPYRFLLVTFAIPMIGCIMASVLMPRILVPLFLRIKSKVMPKYLNAYVSIASNHIQLRQWLGRALLTALLILGLLSILVNVVDPLLFMNLEQYNMFLDQMGFPQLAPPVTLSLSGLIAPIAFGLWSASWAMEDAGLMHYNLPESNDGHLYEIEPIYRRYSSYLKGYAGLASLIFISWTIILLLAANINLEAIVITILVPVFSILQTIPGYFVYSRLSTSFLISKLPEINRISKSELMKSD